MTTNQLIRRSECSPAGIHTACGKLVRDGRIVRVRTGQFVLAAAKCEAVEDQRPLFEAEQPASAPLAELRADPFHSQHVVPFCERDIQEVDGEGRVRDIRLAETAMMGQPRNIRTVIQNHEADLRRYGPLHSRNAVAQRGQSGGTAATEYWLNEGQAIRVLTLLKTEFANEATHAVITVFLATATGSCSRYSRPTIPPSFATSSASTRPPTGKALMSPKVITS
jgi:hypothetical protein